MKRLFAVLWVLAIVATACAPAVIPTPTPPPTKPAPTSTSAAAPTTAPTAARPASTAPAAASPISQPTAAAASSSGTLQKVKLGYVPLLSGSPSYIAYERGYWKEVGLDVEMVPFNSGALMTSSLASSELDAGFGGVGPGTYNALARDVKIIFVADGGQWRPGYGSSYIVVRKDLVDSGKVKSLKDLKGMKVNGETLGSPADLFLRKALESEGMKLEDLDIVRMASADTRAAFTNKAIAATTASEPFPTQVESEGLAVKFLSSDKVLPGHQLAAGFYSEGMMKKPDLGKKFMVGAVRGIRDYMKFLDDGRKDTQVLGYINKWTKVQNKDIQGATSAWFDLNGVPNVSNIKQQQDAWAAIGQVQAKVDLDKFIDLSFAEYAVQVLGKK